MHHNVTASGSSLHNGTAAAVLTQDTTDQNRNVLPSHHTAEELLEVVAPTVTDNNVTDGDVCTGIPEDVDDLIVIVISHPQKAQSLIG
jgi:hypothetical protein